VRKYTFIGLVIILITGLVAAGCSSSTSGKSYKFAPLADFPEEVQLAPVSVQQAYQFAAANPEVLKEVPCYCGCGAMGHTSNYACYIQDDSNPDSLVFDGHALGCSICIDITMDTMDMLDQGMKLPEIKAEIDSVYSAFGPSNMP
jgi:hypothetical protein